ncbi:adenine-specific DNA methylase [Streptococcus downei MFe28]|uniref:Adenine-specific DNA methylase n=1 Tax=Streptococcus downei MFe28 TaxID=764290 RepID=A0A380JDM0_STRDO|nr:adenine-specific DNA methylase [Streptococcus downei MFe28]
MLQSLAQHSTAQHSTAQHSTAQHSTAQHLVKVNSLTSFYDTKNIAEHTLLVCSAFCV